MFFFYKITIQRIVSNLKNESPGQFVRKQANNFMQNDDFFYKENNSVFGGRDIRQKKLRQRLLWLLVVHIIWVFDKCG